MRSAWPIAVSALAHVALVVGARSCPAPRPRVAPALAPSIELLPAPPAVEVALLDEVPSAAFVAPGITKPPTAARDRAALAPPREIAAISTGITAREAPATAPLATEPATGDRPRSAMYDMRRGRVDLSLRTERWDDLDHAPAGTTPQKELTTGKLAPAGGGTFRSEQGVFVAHVDQDGHVKLKDAKNFTIRPALPRPKEVGDAIEAWYRMPNKPTGSIPHQGEREIVSNLPGINDANGGSTLEGDKGPAPSGPLVPMFRGGFDVTDALMRRHGFDPYASKKLAFLDATRDERVQIGKRHTTQQLAKVSQLMQKNLARLWATVLDPAARKRELFTLWDECVETGDDEAVIAGRAARILVVAFIRARLPAGSTDAYTHDEIASLNRARQATAVFAPYE